MAETQDRKPIIVTGRVDIDQASASTLMGKPYSVLPVVMMVEGSYFPSMERKGSERRATSLFFEANEMRSSVNTWNGRPVSVNHPDGQSSCNSPESYDKQVVGQVFNTEYHSETKSLKAELWIDNDRGKFITQRVARGEHFDVSIGAFGDIKSPRTVEEGKAYDYRMVNIVGDHLAILPDSRGACNWEDGCGIRASVYCNESVSKPIDTPFEQSVEKGPVVVHKQKETYNMNNCVDGVQKIEVAATMAEPEMLSFEQAMARMSPMERDRVAVAMKNDSDTKSRNMAKIMNFKEAGFCDKALSRVPDVSVLECICDLIDMVSVPKAPVLPVGAADYSLRGGSNVPVQAASSQDWAGFKEVFETTRDQYSAPMVQMPAANQANR
jgi:hypothetical protein